MPKRFRSFKGKKRVFKRRKGNGAFLYGPVDGNRGRRGGGLTQSIAFSPNAGGDRYFIRASKAYVGTYSNAAGSFTIFDSLHTNSAFDPFGALSSGPGVGVGNLLSSTGQYRFSIVHAFKVELQLCSNAFGTVICMLHRPAGTLQATSMSQMVCLPHTSYKQLPNNSYGPVSRISMFRSTAQVYGQTVKSVAIADSFSAAYNADPTSTTACDIAIVNTQATSNILSYTMRITQWIELFGKNGLT